MEECKWSPQAWLRAKPVYEEILQLPFVKELAAGTLSREIFDRYIAQDILYLRSYTRVLCHIASRLEDAGAAESFMMFASDGVAVEKNLHSQYAVKGGDCMSPACLFYTSFLQAQSYAPVAVEAAAVLPCFWIYNKVGKKILADSGGRENPYADWIECYSDPSFDRFNDRAIEICDQLAHDADEPTRRLMTERFVDGARMEWLFWHGAYDDWRWKF